MSCLWFINLLWGHMLADRREENRYEYSTNLKYCPVSLRFAPFDYYLLPPMMRYAQH